MVLATFTGLSIPKILLYAKTATTRPATERWKAIVRKVLSEEKITFQIYAKNPRNGGQLIYEALVKHAFYGHGFKFDQGMAIADGFQTVAQLAEALAAHYNRPLVRLVLLERESPRAILKWFNGEEWTWFEWYPPPKIPNAK